MSTVNTDHLQAINIVLPIEASNVHSMYLNNYQWLHGLLSKKLRCTQTAADLVQDTFINFLTRETQHPIQEPRAYLTTIAQHILANYYKRKSLEQAYIEAISSLPESVSISTEERMILLETLQQIDNMLDGLPEKVRRAFLLSQIEGLGYVEIARQLNVNVRTIKRYMAQAFEQCLMCIN
ncbi:MAG TPA: sigma-70 family RNA polymerase sigma factor [Methylotenera sp.]|nr:sigma-70 family RNA polymerase sigma factor [Methylotenera sp.]HPH08392.1 sigma-70 family RNA polymerase sigma factor [Methylotenera sp.]HPM48667.1 sigma-70 family RNA polymerase sigma factor [Methylotenera sp.]